MLRQEYHTVCGTNALNFRDEMRSMVRNEVNMKYANLESEMNKKIKSIVEKSLPTAKSSIRDFLDNSIQMHRMQDEILTDASNRLIVVTNNVLMQAVADPAHNSVINAHLQHLNGICEQLYSKEYSCASTLKRLATISKHINRACTKTHGSITSRKE
jgi:hypothetical protein